MGISKYVLSVVLFFLSLNIVQAQENIKIIFDTSIDDGRGNSNEWYNKPTNYAYMDSVELWSYVLDYSYIGLFGKKNREDKGIDAIASLTFTRSIPVVRYDRMLCPRMNFTVYCDADTTYWQERSRKIKNSCSNSRINMRGDMFYFKDFVFICESSIFCQKDTTDFDYCRPVVNYLFSKVDAAKVTDLESLVSQFPIKGNIINFKKLSKKGKKKLRGI